VHAVARESIERKGAIILQSVAKGTSADHAEAIAPQLVLKLAKPHCLENNDGVYVGPDPVEPFFKSLNARHQSSHRALRERLAHDHFHLMAFADQPEVKRSQIAGFGYAEYAHERSVARIDAAAARRAAFCSQKLLA
jgi:hypothetical protein